MTIYNSSKNNYYRNKCKCIRKCNCKYNKQINILIIDNQNLRKNIDELQKEIIRIKKEYDFAVESLIKRMSERTKIIDEILFHKYKSTSWLID